MSYTPKELKEAIIERLNASVIIPHNHKGAFVAYIDNAGMRTVTAFRIGTKWEIDSEISWHPHEDGLRVGMNIMKTW